MQREHVGDDFTKRVMSLNKGICWCLFHNLCMSRFWSSARKNKFSCPRNKVLSALCNYKGSINFYLKRKNNFHSSYWCYTHSFLYSFLILWLACSPRPEPELCIRTCLPIIHMSPFLYLKMYLTQLLIYNHFTSLDFFSINCKRFLFNK